MKTQTHEFIKGYVFAHIHDDFLHSLVTHGPDREVIGKLKVPKVWYGLRCSKCTDESIPESVICEHRAKLTSTFKDLAPKHKINIKIYPYLQYIMFEYTIQKDVVKKMTVAEIEEALGHPVEIIKGE